MTPALNIIKSEINSEIGDKIDGVTVYDRVNVMANVRGNRLYVRENEGNAEKMPRKFRVSDQKSDQKSSQKSSQKNGRVTEKVAEKVTVKVTENQKVILKEIEKNAFVSAQYLSEILGISLRKTKENLSKLKSYNLIRRIGPDKGGHWEVVEK